MLRSIFVSVSLFASIAFAGNAAALLIAPPEEAASDELTCEEETVYGTLIVVDEERSILGLLGTRYRFLAGPDFDDSLLLGRHVKIDVGADCMIENIEMLEDGTESITQNERGPRRNDCTRN